jgi:alanine-glyoxylate transaminase/serine-glyoxylate transaminase/serine-pyruvate transaminase
MKENLLLIPGPTNLSRRVRDAMSGPQVPHVGARYFSAFTETISLARYVFRNAKSPQFVFTGTGTLGMEASVVSLVSRGDRTLTLDTGYFGRRMHLINQAHGAKADLLEFREGAPADPDSLRKKLQTANYAAVFITHVDTSTSVSNPVGELVEECSKAGVLSVIDGVCSVGGVPLDFDRLRPDIAFTASQKAIAAPPGAVLLAASDRAMEHMEKRKAPIESYYLNLLRWKPVMDDPRQYLATPATQIMLAVREALLALKEETLEKRWARHRKLGELTRAKVEEWGFQFVADEGFRSNTVTSFWVKNGTAGEIQKTLEKEHGVVVARGIYEARDTMIRIGHFGILTPTRLEGALDTMGGVLDRLGLGPAGNVAG